jgi:hypothetical protein
MRAIKHSIQHYYQPTNTTCGYAALSTLLSFYDKQVTVEELLENVKQPTFENGKPRGAITTELVIWCLENGFASTLYSFDCEMLDLSWQKLPATELLAKIKANRDRRNVLGLGKEYGQMYMNGYARMIESGGVLKIQPHVTSKLIYELLEVAPVYINVCSDVMDNLGRTKTIGLRQFAEDDEEGSLHTHSIVVYGCEETGDFLVADPWSGLRTIDIEKLLCSITMAQIEGDNMIFQLKKA